MRKLYYLFLRLMCNHRGHLMCWRDDHNWLIYVCMRCYLVAFDKSGKGLYGNMTRSVAWLQDGITGKEIAE